MTKKRPHLGITLALTGGSGAPYTLRLAKHFFEKKIPFAFLVTAAGHTVLETETGLSFPKFDTDTIRLVLSDPGENLYYFAQDDWFAPVASGTGAPETMIVCPASMGFIGRVAHGIASNLVERAADVQLKEGRKLIMVPRETPLSPIHLENMLTLSKLGVTMLPASPGFYHGPETIDDLVNFIAAKVLDAAGMEHDIGKKWGEE